MVTYHFIPFQVTKDFTETIYFETCCEKKISFSILHIVPVCFYLVKMFDFIQSTFDMNRQNIYEINSFFFDNHARGYYLE